MTSPVMSAFSESRKRGDIGLIFPGFVKAQFFVLGERTSPMVIEPLLAKSPTPKRLCITVSETREALARAGTHALLEMSGREILRAFGHRYDVIVTYGGGGDLLTIEQMEWFASNP